MKTPIAAAAVAAALYLLAGAAFAAEPCDVPGYLLFGSNELKHVAEAVQKQHKLTIAVVGTGSSILAGPDGPRSAYPARLEAVLKQKLPGIDVKVVSLVRTRMTTEDLAKGMEKMLADEKPDLVIWQTGTLDAIRRVDPDEFRAALDEGVETLHKGGAFDLYAAGKDNVLAQHVHDCIGRGIAAMIIDAAHLRSPEPKASQ